MKFILNEEINGFDSGKEFETDDRGFLDFGSYLVNPLEIQLAVKAGVLTKKDEEIIAEPAPQELEWPQIQDKYYYPDLNNDLGYASSTWDDYFSDRKKRDTFGIFKTPEEAIAKNDRIIQALKMVE